MNAHEPTPLADEPGLTADERAAARALHDGLEDMELDPMAYRRILDALLEQAAHPLHTVQGGPGPDLAELSRPFPTDYVERKDGQDFVAHHVVTQRLLSIVGPFDFECVQIIRGDVAEQPPDPSSRSRRGRAGTPALHQVVVGGIWRLTATVDGHRVRVEEVGDVGDVHNWGHDGARLKDAASDALKRCAMRLGLGLHLWAQEHYFLDGLLRPLRDRGGDGGHAG